ncbi:hypothetical protein [Nocardia sp. CDC160]|uniref:hypothetical protein n=1 Tax=Nocardia sp. CDC160 TaxID=3112166 RepID=UPI002DB9EE1A|nr:hypothetical protein [Nocardia sp. CDC160]MEC3918812.1 hypothetical protein [Nocardia sp. CDC160]
MRSNHFEEDLLASIQVRWSPEQAHFVAWSTRYPGLTYCDPWSSLAAVDGLVEAIGLDARVTTEGSSAG